MQHFKAVVRLSGDEIATYYGNLVRVRTKAARKEKQWAGSRAIEGKVYESLRIHNWGSHRGLLSDNRFSPLTVTITLAEKGI